MPETMSTEPAGVPSAAEFAAMSRHQVADELAEITQRLVVLEQKGGEDFGNLSGDEFKAVRVLLNRRDAFEKELEALKTVKTRMAAVKASGDGSHVNRPNLGGKSTSGTGSSSGSEVKTLETGDSAFEKYLDRGPFKSFAHMASTVRALSNPHNQSRDAVRLRDEWLGTLHQSESSIKAVYGDVLNDIKAASGLNEFVDAEGGLLVPIEFGSGIWQRSLNQGLNLASFCDNRSVGGNTWVMRGYQDKSRANGSRWGGVLGYWTQEAAQLTAVKSTYRSMSWRLNKLTVLIFATDEQLEDTAGLESDISRVASDEIRFKVNDAIIRGTGVGMPKGLLNEACKIAVVSNNGANATISATDIDNMWMQRADAAGTNYRWLANQDTEGQLSQLKYVSGSTPYAAVWTFMPGSGRGDSGNGAQTMTIPNQLKNRPLDYIEHCETLGTEGDIILWDPSQYAFVTKTTGIKQAVSIHLRFDYDEAAFKFSFRCDGRSYWDASLTRFKGANNLSPILTLESTRSS